MLLAVLFVYLLSFIGADNKLTIAYNYGLSGKLEPCGCSSSKLGGFAQSSILLSKFKEKNKLLILDGGNVVETSSTTDYFKYCTAIKVMDYLKYSAVGVGSNDLGFTPDLLSRAIKGVSFPLISANVFSKARLYNRTSSVNQIAKLIEEDSQVRNYLKTKKASTNLQLFTTPALVINYSRLKIGITAFTNSSNKVKHSGEYIVLPPEYMLLKVVKKLRKECDFVVVMFDGDYNDIKDYVGECNGIDLILTGVRDNFTLGSGAVVNYETIWGNTNDNGKYLILCDIKKSIFGWSKKIHYEDIKADNPDENVKKLIKNDVDNQIARVFFNQKQTPIYEIVQPTQCSSCHSEAYKAYRNSLHFKSRESLSRVNKESHPDCVGCHVFADIKNDQFHSITCQTCHKEVGYQHIDKAQGGIIPDKTVSNISFTQEWCSSKCHNSNNSKKVTNFSETILREASHGLDSKTRLGRKFIAHKNGKLVVTDH